MLWLAVSESGDWSHFQRGIKTKRKKGVSEKWGLLI